MPARRFCLARRVDASSPMPCCRPRFALIPGVLVLADGSVRHTPRARPAAPVPALALRAAHHSRAPPLF